MLGKQTLCQLSYTREFVPILSVSVTNPVSLALAPAKCHDYFYHDNGWHRLSISASARLGWLLQRAAEVFDGDALDVAFGELGERNLLGSDRAGAGAFDAHD